METNFLYMNICVKLCSQNPIYVEYCKQYFDTCVECLDTYSDVTITIELREEEKEHDEAYRDVTGHSSTFSVFYNKDLNKLVVYSVAEEHAKDIMRLVREIILYCCTYRNNCSFLHSACVGYNKKAVALLGKKFSGKTTLCLQLLKNGWDYISNDKLILQRVEDGIHCWGLPIAMGVREGTKELFLEYLQGLKVEEPDNRLFLYPHEIAERYNTRIINDAPLYLIVLPTYEPNANEISITKVSKKLLRNLVYEQYLETLYADLRKTRGFEPHSDFSVLERVCDIPAYRITTNSHLNDKVSNAVQELLDRL